MVITQASNIPWDPNDPEAVQVADATSEWAMDYIPKEEDAYEPTSEMYYPVLESITDVKASSSEGKSPVGALSFSFYWRETIKNILPSNSQGKRTKDVVAFLEHFVLPSRISHVSFSSC